MTATCHFKSENDISQHLHSRQHVGRPIQCSYCGDSFTTASGLTHHLERGACQSNTYSNDLLHAIAQVILDTTTVVYDWWSADERCRTRNSWECSIRGCDKVCKTPHAIEQHMNSPAHEDDKPDPELPNEIHCPGWRCEVVFTTVGAAINHLESGCCGYLSFGAIRDRVISLADDH